MVLLPQDAYSSLLSHQQESRPIVTQVTNLDQELQNVLNSNFPADQKLIHYQQLLHRYIPMKQEQHKPLQINLQQPRPLPARTVLDTVPKNAEKRAKILLNHIETNPQFAFSEKGELVINGQTVGGSNVVDLVHNTVRDKRKVGPPVVGGEQFSQLLEETNVPKAVFGQRPPTPIVLGTPRFQTPPSDDFGPSSSHVLHTPMLNRRNPPRNVGKPRIFTPSWKPYSQRGHPT